MHRLLDADGFGTDRVAGQDLDPDFAVAQRDASRARRRPCDSREDPCRRTEEAMTRHFLSIFDLDRDELLHVLDRAAELKALRGTPAHPEPLRGKSIAVVFEKASTRTRLSFEVGIHELGAQPVTLNSKDTQLGRGEAVEDTARMLSRYVHGVVYRTFGHDRLEALARQATIADVCCLHPRALPVFRR